MIGMLSQRSQPEASLDMSDMFVPLRHIDLTIKWLTITVFQLYQPAKICSTSSLARFLNPTAIIYELGPTMIHLHLASWMNTDHLT